MGLVLSWNFLKSNDPLDEEYIVSEIMINLKDKEK